MNHILPIVVKSFGNIPSMIVAVLVSAAANLLYLAVIILPLVWAVTEIVR